MERCSRRHQVCFAPTLTLLDHLGWLVIMFGVGPVTFPAPLIASSSSHLLIGEPIRNRHDSKWLEMGSPPLSQFGCHLGKCTSHARYKKMLSYW